MTNADVVKLVKAGFDDDLVVAVIRETKKRDFALDAAALVTLKNAGVSDRVIQVMLRPDASTRTLTSVESQERTASPSASARHDAPQPLSVRRTSLQPGIYYAPNGTEEGLVELEPTVFSQGKSSFWKTGLTYGIAKSTMKAVIPGNRARQRIRKGQAVFYFVFAQTSSDPGSSGGFAGWLATATSPNEFILADMDVKTNSRELTMGEFNAFESSSGARATDVVPTEIDKLGPGFYRVRTSEVLEGGEFCFFYAAGVTTFGQGVVGKLFDFGVDPPAR